jgi:hypothetical protein
MTAVREVNVVDRGEPEITEQQGERLTFVVPSTLQAGESSQSLFATYPMVVESPS